MNLGEFKYRGFISYSHADTEMAVRLHRDLERAKYREGRKHKRLGRFFRDTDELGAAHDLGPTLRSAIAESETLIVLCSEHSANSKWVNEEIQHYQATHKAPTVLVVVVGSSTRNRGKPRTDERDVFPPALRTIEGVEPLACSIPKEGYLRAKTKLIAGITGIAFDELWARERRATLASYATSFQIYGAASLLVLFTVALYIATFFTLSRANDKIQELRAVIVDLGHPDIAERHVGAFYGLEDSIFLSISMLLLAMIVGGAVIVWLARFIPDQAHDSARWLVPLLKFGLFGFICAAGVWLTEPSWRSSENWFRDRQFWSAVKDSLLFSALFVALTEVIPAAWARIRYFVEGLFR